MWVLAFCVLVAQAAAGTGMPPKPDFSGHWTLVAAQPADAGVAKALDVRQTVTRTNIRGEPMAPFFSTIEIERRFDANTTTATHLIGIVGGTVGGVASARGGARSAPRPIHSHQAVRWDDRTLVFEHGTSTGDAWQTGEWTERRETWTLRADELLEVTIATSGSNERARNMTASYRRGPGL